MAEKERIYRPILASFIAALGPLSFGYCFSYSSSALLDLKSDDADSALRLTASQGSWFSVSKHCIFFFFFHCHEMLYERSLSKGLFEPHRPTGSEGKIDFRLSLVTRNEELARRPCGTAHLWWDQNYPENNRLLFFTFKISIHFWFFYTSRRITWWDWGRKPTRTA